MYTKAIFTVLSNGISLLSCSVLASTVFASAAVGQGEVPNCIQLNFVIIYGEEWNYAFEYGSEVSNMEQQGRLRIKNEYIYTP